MIFFTFRSTKGLSQLDLYPSFIILQRTKCDGAPRNGSRRDPPGNRRTDSRQSTQLCQQGVLLCRYRYSSSSVLHITFCVLA